MRVFGGGGGGGLSQADADLRYGRLSGATLTGPLAFSGTDHAGIRLNNLTTTERDALTPAAGMVVYNSTANRVQFRNNASWEDLVRRSGDTLTGPLLLPDGSEAAPSMAFAAEPNTGLRRDSNALIFVTTGARRAVIAGGRIILGESGRFSWTSVAQPLGTSTADLELARDAANTLAQRNGANAQTLRVYGTYTDAANYERLAITANATAITLASEAAGTGTVRNLAINAPQVTLTGPLLLPDGSSTAPALAFASATSTGFTLGAGAMIFVANGARRTVLKDTLLLLSSAGSLGWANVAQPTGTSTADLELIRDAADILAQRRGTNAQTSRLYETFTDTSNNSYLSIRAQAADDFQIRPVANGTGTLRGLQLGVASGKLGFFGAAAATKPEVTGSHGSNAALQSLLSALATLGLITNSATA